MLEALPESAKNSSTEVSFPCALTAAAHSLAKPPQSCPFNDFRGDEIMTGWFRNRASGDSH
jgi:hypothetical protein